MKILIVNGSPRSGKDLFCNSAHDYRVLVYPISTVDKVKQVALLAGWDGAKDEKGRKFLSELKDIMTEYGDLPRLHVLNFMKDRLDLLNESEFENNLKDVIFLIQSREPEDIKRWVDENGARALYIWRPGQSVQWGNHADDNVKDYKYDYCLVNDGTIADWERKSISFIDDLRKEDWESYL